MSNGPVAMQDIVERLVLLSKSQRFIEEAKGGYALWYANESDEMPSKPEEVQMEFWRQALSFQPGIRVPDISSGSSVELVHQPLHL